MNNVHIAKRLPAPMCFAAALERLRRRNSMKRYCNAALVYAILAMAGGVFYREFTRFNGFTGRTTLSTPHEMPSQLRMKIKAVHRTAASATLKSAGVVRLHLGGFPPRLFNVDELPKRTAVCCVTQVKSTSSKVRIPTRAIPSLHILGRGFDARHIDLRYGTGHSS